MSDPAKVVIKSKVIIHTINGDDSSQKTASPPRESSLNRSASRNAETDNGVPSSSFRQSRKRKSSRKSDVNVESITLQESAPKNQPVTLKASFLRRKIKEYEGKVVECSFSYQQETFKVDS